MIDLSSSRFLTIDKKKIEYQWIEPTRPNYPTLIFLHSGLGCVALWRDFPAQLAAETGCGALVYSRFGYGQSDSAELPRPATYMHHEALDTLPKIIRALGISDHILIGHSDGGSIALIYAGDVAPPTLRGVITEAAHVFNEEICIASIHKTREAYLTTEMPEKMAKHHKYPDATFWGWSDAWLHPDFWHWNIESYLPTIQAPLLVMQGLDDQYGTLAQVDAIVAGVSEGRTEKLLLAECQHTPHREQTEQTLTKMSAFVQKLC